MVISLRLSRRMDIVYFFLSWAAKPSDRPWNSLGRYEDGIDMRLDGHRHPLIERQGLHSRVYCSVSVGFPSVYGSSYVLSCTGLVCNHVGSLSRDAFRISPLEHKLQDQKVSRQRGLRTALVFKGNGSWPFLAFELDWYSGTHSWTANWLGDVMMRV